MTQFKILGISGSLRKQSYNSAVLRVARDLAPAGVTIEIADIGDLPLYNEDLRAGGSFPEPVQRLRAQIRDADALLIACPEYNYNVSPALKNAVDWASRQPDQPFEWKPYAVMGAATGLMGTVRAQLAFRQMMIGLNACAVNQPQVMIASAAQKFDAEGHLSDAAARDLIVKLIEALVGLARRLKA